MAMLSEMGINVIENEEAEEEDGARARARPSPTDGGSREVTLATVDSETLDRTDDPVRMYLREMGSVELLSREGEIAIAKRIEAGRNTMIAGLCESPLTFQAITIWRDELLGEEILLRDVIDLEATFGPDGARRRRERAPGLETPPSHRPPAQRRGRAPGVCSRRRGPEPPRASRPRTTTTTTTRRRDRPDEEEAAAPAPSDEEEDDDQGNMSLAAMEAALKPQVLETLERIARDYGRLAEMQDDRMSATLNEDESFSSGQERDYQRLRCEIVELVNSLHLHNNRIEALVDQLYGINQRIMTIDCAMVKLADQARINRREFIDEYRGCELEPAWLDRMAASRPRGWDLLTTRSATRSRSCAGRWPRSASTSASTSPSSAAS